MAADLEAPDTEKDEATLDQPDPCATAEHWDKEFSAAKRWFQKYHATCRKIERSYLLEKEDAVTDDTAAPPARYNLFWSNVETILAAVLGRIPKVEVDRTNLDPQDDVARVGGMILERIFNLEYKNLEDSPFYIFQESIRDRMVTGMGIAWARYSFTESVKTIQPEVMPGQPPAPTVEVPTITDEMAPLDYVNWEDFLYSPCKRWQDKRWVARRVPMSKDEVAKRFDQAPSEENPEGIKLSTKIPYSLKSSKGNTEDPDKARVENQADIWEIWNLSNKMVYWYVPGYEELLDIKKDPLQLESYWPVKRPLFATMLSKKCLPRPDFLYVRSQYAELNTVVERCQLLTEALRVVGVYDKTAEGVQRMVSHAANNELIPVDNWAMFAEKGGVKGAVDWLPLEMIINTLEKLEMRKEVLKQEVYEIMGISDIMRGTSDRKETATTNRLKAQFGSARSDTRLNEIARFVTDHTRLRAEIIIKHWQPETILARSQIDKTADAHLAQQAIQFLKSDPSVVARITVAADTIAAPDWDLEKQQRIDFLQAISQFIGQAMPIIEGEPGAAPFMIQIMQWAATGFKGAKQIEGILDQAFQALLTAPPKGPSAEDKLKEAQTAKTEAEARLTNLEAALAAAGIDITQLMALASVPPPLQGIPTPTGSPAMGGGMAPPANIPPRIPKPGVQ